MTDTHAAGPSTDPGPVVKTTPEEGGTHHDHPSEKEYIKIAVILAVITAPITSSAPPPPLPTDSPRADVPAESSSLDSEVTLRRPQPPSLPS